MARVENSVVYRQAEAERTRTRDGEKTVTVTTTDDQGNRVYRQTIQLSLHAALILYKDISFAIRTLLDD